ncbi:hypothetical protein ABH935_008645 [Catenulispora sp. GAS73]
MLGCGAGCACGGSESPTRRSTITRVQYCRPGNEDKRDMPGDRRGLENTAVSYSPERAASTIRLAAMKTFAELGPPGWPSRTP